MARDDMAASRTPGTEQHFLPKSYSPHALYSSPKLLPRTDPCPETFPLHPNPQSPIFSGNHSLPGLHPLWQQHRWQRGFKSLSPLQMWDCTPWLFSWQNQPRDKARSRKALNSRSLFLPQNYTDLLCLEGCRAEIKSNVSRQLSQKKKKKLLPLFSGKLSRVLAQDMRATNPPWGWLCGQKGQAWENNLAPPATLLRH